MKKLIREVIRTIESQLYNNTANLIKLEDFDSPIVYKEICKYYSGKLGIRFAANIEARRFNEFTAANKIEWQNALAYLRSNGFAEDIPLTALRNKMPQMADETSLLLLMGAETALDKGSLKDFTHISVNDVMMSLKRNYGEWFREYLEDNGLLSEKNLLTINNIYKDLFRNVNVDVMSFSRFVDSLDKQDIASFQELVNYIFASLKEYWGIPSILTNVKTPTSKPQKYITNAYQFINNELTLSSAKKKGLIKKLEKYAEDNSIDKSKPFLGFADYDEFAARLMEFLDNRNIDSNRAAFLDADFGVITKILDLPVDSKEPKPVKDSVITLKGEPVIVFLQMLLQACLKYKKEFEVYPTQLEVTVGSIRLSNCNSLDTSEEDESIGFHYENICMYMGGLLDYIQKKVLAAAGLHAVYADDIDPFSSNNFDYIHPKLKSIDKWGANSEIRFSVKAIGDSSDEIKATDFKWIFSPYASWKNSFSLLRLLYNSDGESSAEAPLLTTCSNMDDLIASESEDEFFIKLESIQCQVVSNYSKSVKKSFKDMGCYQDFAKLSIGFRNWADKIISDGFFNSIEEVYQLITNYNKLLEEIAKIYSQYPTSVKEKIGYFLNVFTIISEPNFLQNPKSTEVIVPAYNPAMLEKITARNDYILFSAAELLEEKDSITESNLAAAFKEYSKLATITQGMDVIPSGTDKLICRNVWGYYALYYGDKKHSYINNIELTPDETADNAEVDDQAGIIYYHISNYLKTFPSRADGLNVVFIAPTEIQYVVEGINKVAEALKKTTATINMKVVCFGGSKNIGGYLRYWLSNYMTKERSVTIKTYLQYISYGNCKNELTKILANQDICFIYDILKTDRITFDSYIKTDEDSHSIMKDCQFPMTFIPDTISSTHGVERKVNISQTQFFASECYTQLANRVISPDSKQADYKVMQVLALDSVQKEILDIAHQKCRWVVCEDKAIDRELLQTDGRRIIGFTTGEGCFGEYNVTVSAKPDILVDIQNMLKERFMSKFEYWGAQRADEAAKNCIALTDSLDGSRLLKALNPYDYEIHNFLAYVLTVKMIGLDKEDDKYIVRSLLNLDSYQHWFYETGTRPDFMLITIEKDDALFDEKKPLKISIKLIECKMSLNIDQHIEKAHEQIESGMEFFKKVWDPQSTSISRRYWYTQLYRAIAFSVLKMQDNDPNYGVVNSKIYSVLKGNFSIKWSGDIFAFDLVGYSDAINQESIGAASLYRVGQMCIQKMLLPSLGDSEDFKYAVIEPADDDDDDSFEEEEHDSNSDSQEDLVGIEQIPITIEPVDTDISETMSAPQPQPPVVENIPEETAEQPTSKPEQQKRTITDVRILLGEDIRKKQKYYWEFGNKELNNRHLLINGNSGCGKTYCIQGLLMSTASQGISSVVFDYTGGFTNSKLDPVFKESLQGRIQQRIIKIKKIPINPFAKGEIQIDDDIFVPEEDIDVASKISEILATVYNFGDQQKSAVYSSVLSGMQKHGEKMDFRFMAEGLDSIGTNYSKTVLSKIKPFIDMNPFTIEEDFSWESIRDAEDGIVYVMQLAGYGRDVQVLLTELLLWDIWNFCVKTGDESKPLVLVLDEAQNLSHGEKSPSAKILTEGRKFGISGWYATQFMKPQLTDDEIQRLQQAGQKLYFCPPDDGVTAVAKNIDITPQGSKEWAERLKRLKKGECVTCGNMVVNGNWKKYQPQIIKVISLQERLKNE